MPSATRPDLRRASEAIMLALVFLVPLAIYTGTANANLIKTVIFNTGILILFVLWLVQSISQRKLLWERSYLHIPVMCFVAWSMISALTSQYRWISLNEFGKLLSYAFLYLMVTVHTRNRADARRLIGVALAGAAVACIYGMFQHAGYDWIDWYPKEERILASFGNPTFFAGYLALLLPVAINCCLHQKEAVALRIALYTLAGLMYLCLLYTYTRAAWLGVGVAGVIDIALLWITSRGRSGIHVAARPVMLLSAILLLMTLCAIHGSSGSMQIQRRLATSFETHEASNAQRMTHWKGAIAMFRSHPVMGVGIGAFQVYLPQYQSRRAYATGSTVITDHAHNEVLEQAAETGLIGLGLFAWLGLACGWAVVRTLRSSKDAYWRYLSAGMFSGLVAFLGQNMAGVSMRWVFGGMFFWLALGLIAVAERASRADNTDGAKDPAPSASPITVLGWTRWVTYGCAILVVCGGFCLIVRPFGSELHLKRGNLAADQNKLSEAQTELETAIRMDPYSTGSYYKLASVYDTLGKSRDALSTYERLRTLYPNYARIHYNTAVVLTNLGRYHQALDEYGRAIELEDSAMNYMAVAQLLAYQGKLKQAIPQADHAVRVADQVGPSIGGIPEDIRMSRGKILYDANRISDALTDYATVQKSQPSNKLANFYAGNCLYKLGKPQLAMKSYSAALRYDPTDPRLLGNMGTALYATGDHTRAASYYRRALKIDPREPYAHLNLGVLASKGGELRTALDEFRSASQVGGRSLVGVTAAVAAQQIATR